MSTSDADEPRYIRIQRILETQIVEGKLPAGSQLPGERALARQFGVSQMTVNRAIQELVRKGRLYRRSGAGTFVTDAVQPVRVHGVVLVVPYAEHPQADTYLREPFRAVRNVAQARGLALQVVQADVSEYTEVAQRHSYGALLFVAPPLDAHDVLMNLWQDGTHFVVMGASWQSNLFPCVDSDNFGGARRAVEYLLSLGHRRIAYLNGWEGSTNCADRLRGYQHAMQKWEAPMRPEWIVQAGSDSHLSVEARQQLTDLLIRSEHVTAIFIAGYYLALETLALLRSLGLRVPEDVSIIAFDDPSSAAHLNPPLSTVRQPLYEMGQRAMELLFEVLTSTEPGALCQTIYLPTELVIRESCMRLG
ncbi:MAG: GntR family transcriptional regulator [Armatimonadota bacterium]